MKTGRLTQRIIIAVENEPLPSGAEGESARLKLRDWLELERQLRPALALEVLPFGKLKGREPDVVETFSSRVDILTRETFPTLDEHHLADLLPNYWPSVLRSGVPAIPVITAEPERFPVFVRGERGTFAGGGKVSSRAALMRLRKTGRPLIVRPHVQIRRAATRKDVTLELRAHLVCGKVAVVEYLFPPWAAQKPSAEELYAGHAWAESVALHIVASAEKLATELRCRWFAADFAATDNGLLLVELNPGWCAGIAHAEAVRAVHLAILDGVFNVRTNPKLKPQPAPGIPYTTVLAT